MGVSDEAGSGGVRLDVIMFATPEGKLSKYISGICDGIDSGAVCDEVRGVGTADLSSSGGRPGVLAGRRRNMAIA